MATVAAHSCRENAGTRLRLLQQAGWQGGSYADQATGGISGPHRIKYTTIFHSLAYTAQGIAALTHTPGEEMAKTVIVKIDDKLAMAVLPASCHVDLAMLRAGTAAKMISLAHETEFMDQFPGCEVGAMPPFGNLYGMLVFVDQSLTTDEEIAFNAGSHRELMRLAYADFARLVQPTILRFALPRARAA